MAVQIDVSRDIFQRGANQDRPILPGRVVKPARNVQPLDLHPQILQLRRRRRARRLRQAGSALVWVAGSGSLLTLVAGGLLGLR